MVKNSPIHSNIWKLYLFNWLQWFLLIVPIFVLFLQENGLSMKEVFLLQTSFSIAVLLMEVPSGYFSDRVGRKLTMIIGSIFAFFGVLLYSLSDSFWHFFAAEMLGGIGASFISGTGMAILYDTLLELKQEEKYKSIAGKMITMSSFSEASAGIVGGALALISLRTPLIIEAAVIFLAIPLAFTLIEPKKGKSTEPQKNMLEILKYALIEHKEIKWLTITFALLMSSGITMFWFIQPYLQTIGMHLVFFGVFFALLRFSTGIFSIIAERTEKILGRKKSLILLLTLPAIGYFLVGTFQTLWGIILFLIFQFIRGFSEPVLQDYVNRLVTSDMRATILSINSLIGRLFFSILGPLLGWVNDIYSLQIALFLGAAIFALGGSVSLFFLHKNKVL